MTTGKCEVFVAINGIDGTKVGESCTPDGCIDFEYFTPESAESRLRRQIAISVSVIVFVIYVYLQRQRYLKKNAKYVQDTGGEWIKPSVRTALLWQAEHQFRKYGVQQYPLWKTGEADIGQLGVGIGLYFAYLKYMTRYFIVIAILCIPSLVLNGSGSAYLGRTDVSSLFHVIVSIGNIGLGAQPEVLKVLCWGADCAELSSKDVAWSVAMIDCVISFVFLIATWRLKLFQEQTIVAIDEDTITAADYTVLVENVPSDATDPDEFRAFFSRYGEVADVAIGLNNGRLIDLFQKHGKKELKIEEQTAKLKLYKLQSMQKELKKMKKKLHKLDAKIVALRSKQDFKAVVAYVTFNEEKGQEECLEAYSRSFLHLLPPWLGGRKSATKVKKFRGRYNVKVTQASEPSNVLWENLQHRGFDSFRRSFVANLITVILLMVSLAIVVYIKALQESLRVEGGALVCLSAPSPDDDGAQEQIMWSRFSAGQAQYYAYLECYCAPNFGNQIQNEPEFCQDYVTNQNRLTALSLGSVLIVIGINKLLEEVLKLLAGYEKPNTISAWEKGIASRIFVAQWINTGILVTVVNADWEFYFPALKAFDVAFTGTFRDFSSDWFVAVGNLVVNQSVSAAIVPNLAILAKWPKVFTMQSLLQHRQLTQRKMNKLFEGDDYLLSKRYGALLNILFVILTYASGLPILYFFGIIFFSTAYWCDKIAILRACKKPAQYDEKLAMYCTTMMSVGLIIHLAMAVWFFASIDGEPLIFPFVETLGLPRFIVKRISRRPSGSVLIVLALFLAFEIIARTVGPAVVHVLKQRFLGAVDMQKDSNPSFFEALENQEISGLDNYNIKKNGRYRDAFSSDIAGEEQESESESEESDDFGFDDEEDDDDGK